MSRKSLFVSLAAVVLSGMIWSQPANAAVTEDVLAGRRGPNAGAGTVSLAAGAVTPLTSAEAEALQRAILEEYKARDLYQSVIDAFGSTTPFSRIVGSEQQHVSALVALAQRYGVTVPQPASIDFPAFGTLAEACAAGVDAEIADAALYDELKPVTTHTDILRVYANLQAASLNNHLPAFETCR